LRGWPLHHIGITDIIWCIAYIPEVDGGVVYCPIVFQTYCNGVGLTRSIVLFYLRVYPGVNPIVLFYLRTSVAMTDRAGRVPLEKEEGRGGTVSLLKPK